LKHYLQTFNHISNEKSIVKILANIGVSYLMLGKYHHAIRYLERSKAEHHGDRASYTGPYIAGMLATCYGITGEYNKAIKLLDVTIAQAKSAKHEAILKECLLNRSALSIRMQNYEESIEFSNQALILAKCDKSIYAPALINKATCLLKMKRITEGQHVLESVKPLVEGDEHLTALFDAINHQINLNNAKSRYHLENVVIPYLRAGGGVTMFTALCICKDLEAYYKKKKTKTKALAMAAIIREIYEDMFIDDNDLE